MPIQIILTEGLATKEQAQQMHHDIVAVFLDLHELEGNTFMTPNVIGEVLFVDKGLTFSGMNVSDLAIVGLGVPSFTFGTKEQKTQFIERVTDIVLKATHGKLPIENIYVNVTYTVDGLWGIAGKAYTNEQLGEAIGGAVNKAA